ARAGLGGDGEGPHAPPAAGGGGGRPHPGAGPTRRAAGAPRGGARLGPTVADRWSQGLRDGVPHPVGPWAAPPASSWRCADEPNVHVYVTNRVPPVRPWGRYTLRVTPPSGASAPTSARPSHHPYTSDRYTVASRPGWPDGPDT